MSDDLGSTINSSGGLSVGGSATGSIETGGDNDWFRVNLTAGITYQFNLRGADSAGGTLADPVLSLYDSTGSGITSDDDSGTGYDSYLSYTPPTTGAYFLGARSVSGSATGTYTISASTNDDYAAAVGTSGAISVGGSVVGNIESAGDNDWFRVTLTADHTYQIGLRGADSSGGTLADPYVTLYDSNGNRLSSDDDTGAGYDSLLTATPTASGTYYLGARSANPANIGTYTLSVSDTTAPPTTDDYAASTATTGTAAINVSSSGRIETAGDSDWFKISLTAGTNYQINLRGADSNGGTLADPYLTLYDSSGNAIAFDDDSGSGLDSLLNYTPTASGTYYVGARSVSSTATGSYSLFFSGSAPQPPSDDYAASTSTSGRVSVGGSASGNIETSGDSDWFAVSLTAGNTYRFDVRGSDTSGGTLADPTVTILNSNGTSLVGDDDSGPGYDAQVSYTPTSSGTYYVAAGGARSTTGTYTVVVTNTTATPTDDFAGSISTTGTLSPTQPVTGNIETAGDNDWFRVNLTAGTIYQFNLRGADSNSGTLGDPYVTLYDSNGNSIATDDDSGTGYDSLLTYTPTTSGTYYVGARATGNTAIGTYAMSMIATPQVTDDYAATTSTTGSVAVGSSSTGRIESGGDNDWFRVNLTAGTTYEINLRGADSGGGTLGDPYVTLYNASGTSVGADDDSGTGLDSLLTYTPTASGTYFVGARSVSSSATGSYTVAVSGSAPPTPTDDYAAATSTTGSVAVGGSTTGNIETAGDNDWFRVNLIAGSTYQISVRGADSAGGTLTDPSLTLYNASGTSVASDDDSGTGADSLLTYTPTSSGTYYVGARGYATSATGTYTVGVSTSDDYAGSTNTSGSFSVGGSIKGRLESGGDSDWFRVSLTAGTTYQFDLRGSDSGSDNGGTLTNPFLTLYNASGTALATDDDNGVGEDSLLVYTPTTSGTYYLGASSYVTTATGTYTLQSSTTDDYGATPATAGTVAVGGTASGRIDAGGDADWFRVSLTAGSTYQINVRGADSSGGTLSDPYVTLYDANGSAITSDDDSGTGYDSLLTYTPTTTGTYYVGARAYSSSASGTYTVAVNSTVTDDFTATTGTTGTLAAGSSVTGNIETGGDNDWFRINLTAGNTYQFNLRGTDSSGGTLRDPYLTLYNASGNSVTSDDDSGSGYDSLITYTPTASGTYYLGAKSYSTSATGTYTLAASSTVTDDHSANTATTGTVAIGGSTTGTIETAGDNDWYKVTLTAGTTYQFNLRGADSSGGTLRDPYLTLFDANGTSLASDDDSGAGFDSLLSYTAPTTGTYYVGARSVSSSGTGTYTLAVNSTTTDDFAASTSTSGTLSVGGAAVAGQIETGGDNDWFRVSLTAGTAYQISVSGRDSNAGTLADPYVTLYDASGAAIARDDDSGPGLDSLLTYTPTTSGIYFVGARSYSTVATGSYSVAISTATNKSAPAMSQAASAEPNSASPAIATITGIASATLAMPSASPAIARVTGLESPQAATPTASLAIARVTGPESPAIAAITAIPSFDLSSIVEAAIADNARLPREQALTDSMSAITQVSAASLQLSSILQANAGLDNQLAASLEANPFSRLNDAMLRKNELMATLTDR